MSSDDAHKRPEAAATAALPDVGGGAPRVGLRPRRGAVGAAFPSGKSLPPSAKQGNDTPHPRGAGGSPLVLTAPTAEAWKPLRSGTEAHSVWGPRRAPVGAGVGPQSHSTWCREDKNPASFANCPFGDSKTF